MKMPDTHQSNPAVAIFANGEFSPPADILTHLRGRIIIAADGGARHALALGLTPDVVIGDLDSLSAEEVRDLEARGAQLIRHPRDKDQTDLELALAHARDLAARDVLLLGLLGGRLDQTLANVFLLALPEWDAMRLWFVDGSDTAYLLRDGDALRIRGQPGNTVSLIPLTPTVTGVTTHGLRWPLHDATLHLGRTLTISNELMDEEGEVRVGKGRVVVVVRDD